MTFTFHASYLGINGAKRLMWRQKFKFLEKLHALLSEGQSFSLQELLRPFWDGTSLMRSRSKKLNIKQKCNIQTFKIDQKYKNHLKLCRKKCTCMENVFIFIFAHLPASSALEVVNFIPFSDSLRLLPFHHLPVNDMRAVTSL